jgi:putative tryptophan/tyrosine transport system substrate-binding protein
MERARIDCLDVNLKSALRNFKFAILVGALLFALCSSTQAQQPTKVPRIGFLSAVSPSTISARVEAFRQGCASLGTWKGKTLSLKGDMRKEK